MKNQMESAFVGIDVAIAKNKRLPIVVCASRNGRLEPLALRHAQAPPKGMGNKGSLNEDIIAQFADRTANYLQAIEKEFGVKIKRVAIDAPSAPKRGDAKRRECEKALDRLGISCITTPSEREFDSIRTEARDHLAQSGIESKVPHANQLWMLAGFALFKRLRREWPCIEVFPQAIAVSLNSHQVHKSHVDGLLTQLKALQSHTRWPENVDVRSLATIAYGSRHDRLDAYLSAWVASLRERDRLSIGVPPDDVIWIPKTSHSLKRHRQQKRPLR